MESYFLATFLICCAFIFIKWQIDYAKWKGRRSHSAEKNKAETTSTGSIGIAGTSSGFNKESHDVTTTTTVPYEAGSQNENLNTDFGESDNSGSEGGGFDSGGGHT